MAPSASLRILVVGFRASERSSLRDWLQHSAPSPVEVDLVEARDGELTLSAVKHSPANVILLDLDAWDEREQNTVRQLRRDAPNVPIVIVTDAAHESAAFSAVQAGGQDYVIKDLDHTRVLWRAIRHAIERASLARRRDALLIREHDARLAAEAARADANAARAKAETLEHRARFLADASVALATTLDARTTLATAARLAVPTLGCGAATLIVGDGGRMELVEAADDGSRAGARVLAVTRRVVRGDPVPRVLARARRRGYPVLNGMSDGSPNVSALEHGAARAARDYCVLIPLRSRGRTLGLLVLITGKCSDLAEVADRALLQAFATRAASAVDNGCLYEASQRATATRDQVLGIVSHDLRNPLSAIGICAKALETPERLSAGEARRLALTIGDAVTWTQRLLGDLLDVASIEGGRLSMHSGEIDPIVLLGKSLDLFEHGPTNVVVRLAPGVPDSLPWVVGDEQRILQVLANLIANARKFTPPGGSITLGARATSDAVRFWVSDMGPGIDPDDQPHIFDWFWRATHERAERGTGLGLAIAKGIVEGHGGSITVESTPGHGATFSFTIPLARPVAAVTIERVSATR
jgi:signal transduction histidine kinase/DNA-binding NarL/FixJ family response regulator